MIDKGSGVLLSISFDFQVLRMVYHPLKRRLVAGTFVGLHCHLEHGGIVIHIQVKKAIEGILTCLWGQGATIGVIFAFPCEEGIYLIGGVAYEKGLVVVGEIYIYKEETEAIAITIFGKGSLFSDHFVQDFFIIDLKTSAYYWNRDTHTCLEVLQGYDETTPKEVQEVIQLKIFLSKPLLDIGFFDEFGFCFFEELIVMLHIERPCDCHRHFLWEVLEELFVKRGFSYMVFV